MMPLARLLVLGALIAGMLFAACGGRPAYRVDRVEQVCDGVVLFTQDFSYHDDGRLDAVNLLRWAPQAQQRRHEVVHDSAGRPETVTVFDRALEGPETVEGDYRYVWEGDTLASVRRGFSGSSLVWSLRFEYDGGKLTAYNAGLEENSSGIVDKERCDLSWGPHGPSAYACRVETTRLAPQRLDYRLDYDEAGTLNRVVYPGDLTVRFNWQDGRIEDIRQDGVLRFEYDDQGRVISMSGDVFSAASSCEISIRYGAGDVLGLVPALPVPRLHLVQTMLGFDGRIYAPEPRSLAWLQ